MIDKAQQCYLEVFSLIISVVIVLCFGLVMKSTYKEAAQFVQNGKFINTTEYQVSCSTSIITYHYQVNKKKFQNSSSIPRNLDNLCNGKEKLSISIVYLPHAPQVSSIQTIKDFQLRIDLIELWLLFVLIGTFLGLIAIGKRVMGK